MTTTLVPGPILIWGRPPHSPTSPFSIPITSPLEIDAAFVGMNCLNATADADPEVSTNVMAHRLIGDSSGYASIDQTLPTTETRVSISTIGDLSSPSVTFIWDFESRSRFSWPFQSDGRAPSTLTLDPSDSDLVTFFGPPSLWGGLSPYPTHRPEWKRTSTVPSSPSLGSRAFGTSPTVSWRTSSGCRQLGVMVQSCPSLCSFIVLDSSGRGTQTLLQIPRYSQRLHLRLSGLPLSAFADPAPPSWLEPPSRGMEW